MAIESLAGKEERIDGIYRLGGAIRLSARSAVYETEFGEGGEAIPAVIRIREMESADEAERLEQRLRNAGQLAHPNLLKIYAVGSSALNDVPVVYVVMERADESLEGVLAERALTEGETREMVVPVADALEYLHKKGYAHSRLRPSNVLAVKDQLKLSADSVRASDGDAAEDMRALGVLIVQAVTQRMPGADGHFEEIPQPLGDIVRHCLDPDCASRWTAEQVKFRLARAPLVVEEALRVEEHRDEEDPTAGLPKWIFAGLVALVLIVLLVSVVRSHAPAPAVTPVATSASQRVAPVPSSVTPEVVVSHSNPSDARKASGWSVIAGAYGSREAAEKRMRELAKKWPKFQIGISESHAEKTPYLVVLGQNLSEDQAEALRKRAVGSGLPRDTYIKRVM